MLRWMGHRRKEPTDGAGGDETEHRDDKMADGAAAGSATPSTAKEKPPRKGGKLGMKQSVYLPRVALKGGAGDGNSTGKPETVKCDAGPNFHTGGDDAWSENFYLRSETKFRGLNPLYMDTYKTRRFSRQSTPSGEKSSSSGYGGSNLYSAPSDHQLYTEMKSKLDGVLEQNPNYVKSIQVAKRKNKSTHSSGTSTGTLSTIPEGRIDFTIPRPIWPQFGRNPNQRTTNPNPEYDSLVDEAVLLYTSLSNHQPEVVHQHHQATEFSVKDVLLELLNHVNATIEGKGVLTPEEMLKRVNERISESIEALKHCTEEEMRLLCINLRNSKKVDSVVRAFSHSSSSGNSSQSSPEWSGHRIRGRSVSMETEDIYHLPSSSSSGFSDCMFKDGMTVINNMASNQLPMFVHDDLASVPNGVRNAMIYGTLCRNGSPLTRPFPLDGAAIGGSTIGSCSDSSKMACRLGGSYGKMESICLADSCSDKLSAGVISAEVVSAGGAGSVGQENGAKQSLLRVDDEKPSVWEQYYGVNGVKLRMEVMDVKEDGQEEVKVDLNYVPKPTDIPIFPGGRPEADFTLDVPRSEMLSKRMKEDKKWRCRCRLLTSFLGLVFFLLSVMAVSLMLTKGRKMFGSMA